MTNEDILAAVRTYRNSHSGFAGTAAKEQMLAIEAREDAEILNGVYSAPATQFILKQLSLTDSV